MKTDLDPLRHALPMQALCEKHGLTFKPEAGNMVARCPFHDSERSSFTIHGGDPHRAWCYGCEWGGSIIDFHAECRGLSTEGREFIQVMEELHAMAGLTVARSDIPLSRPKFLHRPSILDQKPPDLPELSPLNEHCLLELAEVRGYSVEGLREASCRGFLHYADWPLSKEGRTTSSSCASWCLTDSSRRVAQFRRLDGKPYFASPASDGIKAWSTSGARWLVGCGDVTPETELVLLVEGGADFLAAWTLIERHAASLSPAPSLAVCCVFGATMSIAPECRAMLAGKRVRIIMDVDAPRLMRRRGVEIMSSPGMEAAAKWSRELTEAGAVVDVYSLEGLTCRKNGEERPVGDLNDLLLMGDPKRRAATARQLLSPAPAVPLPGESALRAGTVRRPGPDSAAGFIPGPSPEPVPSAPSIPEEPAPAPRAPTPAEILAANERREYEAVLRKHGAGVLLSGREKALIKRMDAAEAARPPEGGPPPEDLIDRVCQDLDAWWVNGDGAVFQVGNGSQWREVPQQALVTMLQKRGISDKAVGGSLVTQTNDSIVHIMDNRILDRAVEGLAGFRRGIHQFKSIRILIRKGPFIIEPAEGDCELILTLLMGLLGLDGVEGGASMIQFEMFLYWLARAARCVHLPGRIHLNSQVVIIAGPAGAGKSLIQHGIMTPMLGGRSADPSLYLFGDSNFNDGWAHCEHLLIEDPRPNVRTHDRLLFAQKLKGLVVNPEHVVHFKGKGEFNVPNRHVPSISINDDPDSIRILPKLTPDFSEKVMLFRVRDWPLPMPAREAEEKEAFINAISGQMPAFLHYLLSLKVPEHLLDPKQRFNVKSYINPDLALLLNEDSPESELLALLDHVTVRLSENSLDRSLWETGEACSPAEYLEKHPLLRATSEQHGFLKKCGEQKRRVWVGSSLALQGLMQHCSNPAAWRKVADHNALQRLLGRLAEDRPDRVCAYRRTAGREWIIASRPEAEGS